MGKRIGADARGTDRAIRGAFDVALNARDADEMMTYCADDVVWEVPSVPPTAEGKEAVRTEFEELFQGLPDIQTTEGLILVQSQETLFDFRYVSLLLTICKPSPKADPWVNPNPKRSLDAALGSDNIVVVEHVAFGTHLGLFMDIPATGQSIQIVHMDIYEFEGDKIKKITTYMDNVGIMVQMGLMPAGELPALEPSFELPEPEPTGLAPLDAQAEAMARWNAHDLVLWAKMIHPEADGLYNALGIPINRDAVIALNELYFLGLPDIQAEVVRMTDMGDRWVLNEWVFAGTHDGPYFGIPATGKPVTNRVAWISRFDEDGIITFFHVYFDNLGVLVQMGVVELPGPTSVLPTTWGQVKSLFQE